MEFDCWSNQVVHLYIILCFYLSFYPLYLGTRKKRKEKKYYSQVRKYSKTPEGKKKNSSLKAMLYFCGNAFLFEILEK